MEIDRQTPLIDLRSYLLGSWQLARAIEDRRAMQSGTLVGTCSFTDQEDYLYSQEDGVMTLGNHSGTAHRAYRYYFDQASIARITHGDNAPFVTVDLTHGAGSARHHCGDDLYTGNFSIESDTEWRQEWTVMGPSKDYKLISRYLRS